MHENLDHSTPSSETTSFISQGPAKQKNPKDLIQAAVLISEV